MTHTSSSFRNGEVAVEDHQSPISAPNFYTSREVLPHHEVHKLKGILESSASGNTSPNVLPKALLTVSHSVHTGDRVFDFEIKGVVDPGVSKSEVRQLLVGSPAVCVDRRTRQNPTLNERQEDGCYPLTPMTWYDETPFQLQPEPNPPLWLFLVDDSPSGTHTTHKHKQVLELYSSFSVSRLYSIHLFFSF